MDVLLSIKPEFADKIFNGTKNMSSGKAIFKRTDVHRVIASMRHHRCKGLLENFR